MDETPFCVNCLSKGPDTGREFVAELGAMKLARRQFLVLVGLSAIDVILETRGYGAVTLALRTASNILENDLTPVPLDAYEEIVARVCRFFDPALRSYLKSIPIATSNRAQTAYCIVDYPRDNESLIVVSPDFFNTARESKYWRDYYSKPPYDMSPGQPVFSEDFRLHLLAHEMLHIAQTKMQIEIEQFYALVEQWYWNDSFGRPTWCGRIPGEATKSNYTKFVLWWNVYGHPGNPDKEVDNAWQQMVYCERYVQSARGVEEFAYVGATLLVPMDTENRTTRLNEISDGMYNSYSGIIDPAILALRFSHS